jgi:hypothetical protein
MRKSNLEFAVTLEPELFDRLKTEAQRLGVTLEWIVASLVADTIESDHRKPALC